MEKIRNFIYNLFVKYFLPKHRFTIGEYIKDLAENKYRIEALYYDSNLKPFVIAINPNGDIRSFSELGLQKIADDDF